MKTYASIDSQLIPKWPVNLIVWLNDSFPIFYSGDFIMKVTIQLVVNDEQGQTHIEDLLQFHKGVAKEVKWTPYTGQ
jgi:hypothetical protein